MPRELFKDYAGRIMQHTSKEGMLRHTESHSFELCTSTEDTSMISVQDPCIQGVKIKEFTEILGKRKKKWLGVISRCCLMAVEFD